VRRRDDDGQATVWAIGLIAVLVSLTWTTLLLAAGVARQHHLDGAADLAALSAAEARQRGLDACRTASRLAEANRVTLSDCTVDGFDVVVSVVDHLALPVGIEVHLTSRARAGPA
jgi:secretion/DNA translocation related TadE-like protein